MPTQPRQPSGSSLAAARGHDGSGWLGLMSKRKEKLIIPDHWYRLVDVRPASPSEGEALAQGQPPSRSGLGRFDPALGPFSSPTSFTTLWSASFEFLRDISALDEDFVAILEAWLPHWIEGPNKTKPTWFALNKSDRAHLSPNDQMICCGRRILNWLAHLLPVTHKLSPALQAKVWACFLADVRRVSEPDDGWRGQLIAAFVPKSRRVLWMRACAILGIQACAPGMLKQDLVEEAEACARDLVGPDGMFADGSVLGTLSATADLAMLTKIEAMEPIFDRAAQAIATLRRSDGSLVTFGGQHGFRGLADAVLGTRDWRRSPVLKTGAIGFVEAGSSRLWTRCPSATGFHGPIGELEWKGHTLLTSLETHVSALVLDEPVQISTPQTRRRDEEGKITLEAKCLMEARGKSFSCVRTLTISADGTLVEGQDGLFATLGNFVPQTAHARFVLGPNCHTIISKDGQSALIQLPRGEAWRLRALGLQLSLERVINPSKNSSQRAINKILVRPVDGQLTRKDMVFRWELQLEERL
jgi:hypothetical protein